MNFVTEPYEAMIYVDGQLQRAPDGTPYRTPCTVRGVAGGSHRVVFEWDPFDPPVGDGKFDAGIVDLTRESADHRDRAAENRMNEPQSFVVPPLGGRHHARTTKPPKGGTTNTGLRTNS